MHLQTYIFNEIYVYSLNKIFTVFAVQEAIQFICELKCTIIVFKIIVFKIIVFKILLTLLLPLLLTI